MCFSYDVSDVKIKLTSKFRNIMTLFKNYTLTLPLPPDLGAVPKNSLAVASP